MSRPGMRARGLASLTRSRDCRLDGAINARGEIVFYTASHGAYNTDGFRASPFR